MRHIKIIVSIFFLILFSGQIKAQEWEFTFKSHQSVARNGLPDLRFSGFSLAFDYNYLIVAEQRIGFGLEGGRSTLGYYTNVRAKYLYDFFLTRNFYIGTGGEIYMGAGFDKTEACFLGGLGAIIELGYDFTKHFSLALSTGVRWTGTDIKTLSPSWLVHSAWEWPVSLHFRFSAPHKNKTN